MISTRKITTSRRNCPMVNCLRASTPKEARKSVSKTYRRSPWNRSVSLQIARNIRHRTETSGVKLSNVEQKFMKPEETQQLSCTGNLEKALPHQPLPPPSHVLTAQDSPMHRLVSLAICILTDVFLNYKVDQVILIDYNGHIHSHTHTHTHTTFRARVCVCVCVKNF